MARITRPRRWTRLNVVLGWIIPPLLVLFAYKSYKLVVFEISSCLFSAGLGRTLYLAQFHVLLLYVAVCYWICYTASADSLKIPFDPPPHVQNRSVIYECDDAGNPARCVHCKGAWRPMRARHCHDCGRCRAGFDHHCAWMGNCITMPQNYKAFQLFMVAAILLISITAFPLVGNVVQTVKLVVRHTWRTPEMEEKWWSKWWSWAGGPVYRYLIALYLGFRQYPGLEPQPPPLFPPSVAYWRSADGTLYEYDTWTCPTLATPHLSPLVLITLGYFIAAIGVAMTYTTLKHALEGVGTIELERARSWRKIVDNPLFDAAHPGPWDPRIKLFVPNARGVANVITVEPEVRLFDRGPWLNWGNLFGFRWQEMLVPWIPPPSNGIDYVLNSTVKEQLFAEDEEEAAENG